VETEDGEARVS